jgi:glycerol-3-phosphate cytidylyltransferase
MLHIGHIRLLRFAKAQGSFLVVGVSSDELHRSKKQRDPFFDEKTRMEMIQSIKYVDEVFLEESLEAKAEYIGHHQAEVFVMGEDWRGKYDDLLDQVQVRYAPRPSIVSTTNIMSRLKAGASMHGVDTASIAASQPGTGGES